MMNISRSRQPLALAPLMLPACALGLSTPTLHAQLHATDIAMKVEHGRIITGGVDGGVPIFPRQVFTSVLGLYGVPGATFDPGFDSETGAFPASTAVGISVRSALRRWDGQLFSTIPPERLEIIRSTMITTPPHDPADCTPADHLQLGITTTTGRLHVHPGYQLLAPASQGIYLLEVHAWFGAPGQGQSEPFFVLFSQGEDPQVLETAALWVEANLARPCYANCDRSTAAPILNIDDFTCFINAFAAGDCYANCDGSTTLPVLNIDDFTCFLNRFAAGCS